MGRNRTGPPCSVGHPTADAPGGRRADHPRARRQRYTPRQTTTTDDADRPQTTDASEQNNTGPLCEPVTTID